MIIRVTYQCTCGAKKTIDITNLPIEEQEIYPWPDTIPCSYTAEMRQGCTGIATRQEVT